MNKLVTTDPSKQNQHHYKINRRTKYRHVSYEWTIACFVSSEVAGHFGPVFKSLPKSFPNTFFHDVVPAWICLRVQRASVRGSGTKHPEYDFIGADMALLHTMAALYCIYMLGGPRYLDTHVCFHNGFGLVDQLVRFLCCHRLLRYRRRHHTHAQSPVTCHRASRAIQSRPRRAVTYSTVQ